MTAPLFYTLAPSLRRDGAPRALAVTRIGAKTLGGHYLNGDSGFARRGDCIGRFASPAAAAQAEADARRDHRQHEIHVQRQHRQFHADLRCRIEGQHSEGRHAEGVRA